MSRLRDSKFAWRSEPLTMTRPSATPRRALRIDRRVDLPDPLGPRMQANSWGRMTTLTPLSRTRLPPDSASTTQRRSRPTSSALSTRESRASALPSKTSPKGPMSIRSPLRSLAEPTTGSPLRNVPLGLPRSVMVAAPSFESILAWSRETLGCGRRIWTRASSRPMWSRRTSG